MVLRQGSLKPSIDPDGTRQEHGEQAEGKSEQASLPRQFTFAGAVLGRWRKIGCVWHGVAVPAAVSPEDDAADGAREGHDGQQQ